MFVMKITKLIKKFINARPGILCVNYVEIAYMNVRFVRHRMRGQEITQLKKLSSK